MTKTKTGAKGGGSSYKRTQAANACAACRLTKLKCSGRHPKCARCQARNLDCVWSVREGMTAREHINHELERQQRDLGNVLNVLDVLRNGSDQEAAETLVRLRLGQTIEEASEESAKVRARRKAQDASPDEQSVAGSWQTSERGSQRHDSHFGGGSISLSEPAGSPNTLHTSWSTTAEVPCPSDGEGDEPQPQGRAFDTQVASWSFPVAPDTHFSPLDWNDVSTQQAEQSAFLMDGIFAQYDVGGGDGNDSAPSLWNSYSMFSM